MRTVTITCDECGQTEELENNLDPEAGELEGWATVTVWAGESCELSSPAILGRKIHLCISCLLQNLGGVLPELE